MERGNKVLKGDSTKKFIVSRLDSMAERGEIFLVSDVEENMEYVLKNYQGQHEPLISKLLGGIIGPEIYSIGKGISFVEEYFGESSLLENPKDKFKKLYQLSPLVGGRIVGKMFAFMHNKNIILDHSRWFEEF